MKKIKEAGCYIIRNEKRGDEYLQEWENTINTKYDSLPSFFECQHPKSVD